MRHSVLSSTGIEVVHKDSLGQKGSLMSPVSDTSHDQPTRPMEPPLACADLPAMGGELGSAPTDFVVDEIPLYAPSGEGEHVYVRIRKRELTTPELQQIVARAAHVRERDIGVAGMKDKYAVTSQWFSLPRSAAPSSEWQLPANVEVLETTRHTNKLRTGHQAGNRFVLRVVGVPEGAWERGLAIAERLRERGLPNYFGVQRYGRGAGNLADALAWLATRQGDGGGNRHGRRFQNKLLPSVLQSEVFNRFLARRAPLGLDRLLQGDVVRLDGSASVFVVEDVAREQPRLSQGDIHITGPLPGAKMRPAADEAARIEGEVLAELGLSQQAFAGLGELAPGTRRDLVVWPKDLNLRRDETGAIILEFSLPSGSYATQLVREFTRAPWAEPRAQRSTAA